MKKFTKGTSLKLNPTALGLAFGISIGAYVLFVGLMAWFFDWGTPMVNIMSSWYVEFGTNLLGVIIGAVWGFFDGLIFGAIAGWLYNLFIKK